MSRKRRAQDGGGTGFYKKSTWDNLDRRAHKSERFVQRTNTVNRQTVTQPNPNNERMGIGTGILVGGAMIAPYVPYAIATKMGIDVTRFALNEATDAVTGAIDYGLGPAANRGPTQNIIGQQTEFSRDLVRYATNKAGKVTGGSWFDEDPENPFKSATREVPDNLPTDQILNNVAEAVQNPLNPNKQITGLGETDDWLRTIRDVPQEIKQQTSSVTEAMLGAPERLGRTFVPNWFFDRLPAWMTDKIKYDPMPDSDIVNQEGVDSLRNRFKSKKGAALSTQPEEPEEPEELEELEPELELPTFDEKMENLPNFVKQNPNFELTLRTTDMVFNPDSKADLIKQELEKVPNYEFLPPEQQDIEYFKARKAVEDFLENPPRAETEAAPPAETEAVPPAETPGERFLREQFGAAIGEAQDEALPTENEFHKSLETPSVEETTVKGPAFDSLKGHARSLGAGFIGAAVGSAIADFLDPEGAAAQNQDHTTVRGAAHTILSDALIAGSTTGAAAGLGASAAEAGLMGVGAGVGIAAQQGIKAGMDETDAFGRGETELTSTTVGMGIGGAASEAVGTLAAGGAVDAAAGVSIGLAGLGAGIMAGGLAAVAIEGAEYKARHGEGEGVQMFKDQTKEEKDKGVMEAGGRGSAYAAGHIAPFKTAQQNMYKTIDAVVEPIDNATKPIGEALGIGG